MDIFNNLAEAIIKGDHIRVKELTEAALRENVSVKEILHKGLIPGMDVIGGRFKNNEIWLPEVMIAARALKAGLEILEPLMSPSESVNVGKFLIGTVKDDIHDVGKNMVVMMMKGAGFQVIDLGVGVSPERFVEMIREVKPEIIGMSALLTVTLPNVGLTIEAITEAGLRDRVKIMVGGAPVTQAFADKVGADGYAPNSAEAVTKARQLIGMA